MKRKKIDLNIERNIIIDMITSTKFLRDTSCIIKPKYFKTSYGKLISSWILEYFTEFKRAPEKEIQSIFYQKSTTIRDEDAVEDISDFLSNLSKEYISTENKNVDFSIKNAVQYLKLRSLEILKDSLDLAVVSGDTVKGEQLISEYNRVEKQSGAGISLLNDADEISSAFFEEEEVMFSFPGVLGEVCGRFLRGDLVAYLAAGKKGKSFFMLYTGETAAYYGFKVVMFSLEMTQSQILRRGWTSLVGQPRKDLKIEVPKFIKLEHPKYKWEVILESKDKKAIDTKEIKKQQRKLRKIFRTGDMKIVTLPAYSATVEDIEAHLDNFYYYENYVPDVIIIDYADIVAPSRNYRGDYRHQLDDIWKKLRKMAQERNVLVVTASQAGRAAFNKDAKEENIVEDIRKIAHVSKMIAINKSKADNKINAVRVEQLAERDGRRNYRQALVLQCLEIGRPYIDSKYNDEVIRDEK